MQNNYFHSFTNNKLITELSADGLVAVDSDVIKFTLPGKIGVTIDDLYLDPDDEGAVVVRYHDVGYVFYLDNFGDATRVHKTSLEIDLIVRALAGCDKFEAYLERIGGCTGIRVVDPGRQVEKESTSDYSNNIFDNGKWLLRHLLKLKTKTSQIGITRPDVS